MGHSAAAFLAGLIGAMATSVLALLVRGWCGVSVGLEPAAAALLGLDYDAPLAVGVGLATHLMIGGGFGLFYAEGFRGIGAGGGWTVGASFSLIHVFVSGWLVAVVPALTIPGPAYDPGIFMSASGLAGVFWFTLLHMLFGGVVGCVYRRGVEMVASPRSALP